MCGLADMYRLSREISCCMYPEGGGPSEVIDVGTGSTRLESHISEDTNVDIELRDFSQQILLR